MASARAIPRNRHLFLWLITSRLAAQQLTDRPRTVGGAYGNKARAPPPSRRSGTKLPEPGSLLPQVNSTYAHSQHVPTACQCAGSKASVKQFGCLPSKNPVARRCFHVGPRKMAVTLRRSHMFGKKPSLFLIGTNVVCATSCPTSCDETGYRNSAEQLAIAALIMPSKKATSR